MSMTAQTYWQSSGEKWEGQHNYSLKYEVHKNAISCFSIRKDWKLTVRAKYLALHWLLRGFFRVHVGSCEKGLCPLSSLLSFLSPLSLSPSLSLSLSLSLCLSRSLSLSLSLSLFLPLSALSLSL